MSKIISLESKDYQTYFTEDFTVLKNLLNHTTDMLLILNEDNIIIYYNNTFAEKLNTEDMNLIFKKRLGEKFGCVNSASSKEGCGFSESCKHCGALSVILKSRTTSQKISEEIQIITHKNGINENHEFLLSAHSIEFKLKRYTLVSLTNISSKNRLEYLNKIFFHDVINKIGALSSLFSLVNIKSESSEFLKVPRDIMVVINNGLNDLLYDIEFQKKVQLAETNQLNLVIENLNSLDFIKCKVNYFNLMEKFKNIKLVIEPQSENFEFSTDTSLLSRVIENIILNALESSEKGMCVTIGIFKSGENFEVNVHNQTHMPDSVKYKLFHKSYSTKGEGRGYGTYSIKLLTEKYLKGSVSFETNRQKGTTFKILLPINFEN